MGHRRGWEAHEIARGHFKLLVVYLRDAASGEDVDPLLLPVVGVVDERLLARGDADPAHTEPR
jgi:hypothetical protein